MKTKCVSIRRILVVVFVVLSIIVMIGPLGYTILSSLKSGTEFYAVPAKIIPSKLVWSNYKETLRWIPIFKGYFNSLLVASIVTLTNLFFGSMGGYAFSKLRFPGRDIIFIFILSTMMLPFFLVMIPLYVIIKNLGMLDSYQGLILPYIMFPLSIFLMRQFMISVPNELIDAAKIDGCSEFSVYWRIMLPLSGPGLAVVAILTFMMLWDNFLWPLMIIQAEERMTLPVLLQILQMKADLNKSLVICGVVMAVIPMLVVYLMLQKYIVKGFILSGLKQ